MMRQRKHEALSVSRLIHEVLVGQLSIPFRQIVNDSTFSKYTGARRPDLLISEFEFDGHNDDQFVANLVAYAEVKDNTCSFNDRDWRDAIKHGKEKAQQLQVPCFIVTNCKMSAFYNTRTLDEITLNKNAIREFQTIDILRLIKNRLTKDSSLSNIQTNVDSISTISEAVFNKKLWELAAIYRGISFKDNQQKIDFTIGFVSLEFYEEKSVIENRKDKRAIYWSECADESDEKLVANIDSYVRRLSDDTDFREFQSLISTLRDAIVEGKKSLVPKEDVRRIFDIINSMRPLHGAGFDLFGSVYEMFASSKEKKDFGEYFTRRHYAHLLAKLLLSSEKYWNPNREFTVLDPACGTGGFLTESYKVLENYYQIAGSSDETKARAFLEGRCFYGIDVREENISRARLNMFLVGDGHTNMKAANSLQADRHPFGVSSFDYVITNPPYGPGTIQADTSAVSTVRTEIAFLCRVRQLLKIGGHACVIQPDGVLENPSLTAFRKELLETCDITAIISLPKFAFAPYTKEKTYAVFFTKRCLAPSRSQTCPIWMYIIDNDGLANSDKRFPTKLRNNRNGWVHDEISGWVTTDGDEMPGVLEERWLKYDDSGAGYTEWIDERGETVRLRKGGNVPIDSVTSDKYLSLLPEYYLRTEKHRNDGQAQYKEYQAHDLPVCELFDISGGNSGLTEEYLYSLLFHDGERRYSLLTGSVDVCSAKKIHRCQDPKNGDRKIRVISGEGIHIVRKGKAGHINYLPKGDYTMNDDAYVLTKKQPAVYQVSLEWIARTQMEMFREYASSSDNGTWNKGGFLKHAKISLPSYDEQLMVLQSEGKP